jgi:hypothetical protein
MSRNNKPSAQRETIWEFEYRLKQESKAVLLKAKEQETKNK